MLSSLSSMFSKWGQKEYITGLLCISVVFLFADQNLMAPNLSAIATDFGFNDYRKDQLLGANIAAGFFIVGGLASLIAGYFADLGDRCVLFGSIVICGEVACLGTYFTSTYFELLVCRVLTGVGIGGATPVVFSLFADCYPGTSRVHIATVVGIAMSVGISFGQLVAGLMGPAYGWRTPFLVISIPAIFCGILCIFSLEDPPRGDQEEVMIKIRQAHKDMYGDSSESLPQPLTSLLLRSEFTKAERKEEIDESSCPQPCAQRTGNGFSAGNRHLLAAGDAFSNSVCRLYPSNLKHLQKQYPFLAHYTQLYGPSVCTPPASGLQQLIPPHASESQETKWICSIEQQDYYSIHTNKTNSHQQVCCSSSGGTDELTEDIHCDTPPVFVQNPVVGEEFRTPSMLSDNGVQSEAPCGSRNTVHSARNSGSDELRDTTQEYHVVELDTPHVEQNSSPPPPIPQSVDAGATHHYEEKFEWRTLCLLLQCPTVLLIYLQGIPGCVPWGVIYIYLNDFLATNQGLSVTEATWCLVLFGVGSVFGQFVGGLVGQWLYNNGCVQLQCTMMAASTALSVFPLLFLVNTSIHDNAHRSSDIWVFYIMSALLGFIVSINGPNLRSILQNVSPPELRGSAFAIFNLTDDIGKGGGSVVVALLISSTGSRRSAFSYAALLWGVCGLLLAALTFTVPSDEKKCQLSVLRSMALGRHPCPLITEQDLSSNTDRDGRHHGRHYPKDSDSHGLGSIGIHGYGYDRDRDESVPGIYKYGPLQFNSPL